MGLLLHPQPPRVVWLQEVVQRTWHAHIRPHFSAAGYTLVPAEPVTDSEYFCVAAVHPSLSVSEGWIHRFEGSSMGRALLGVRAQHDAADWLFLTSHIESLRSGADERQRQLGEVAAALADHPGPAVFGGDTNLRDSELPGIARIDSVQDAWVECGSPSAHRYTWDLRRNQDTTRAIRLRFDRIWLNARCNATAVCTSGEAAVAGGLCVSDHLALAAEVVSTAPGSGPSPS